MKLEYLIPNVTVVRFEIEDVITTSGGEMDFVSEMDSTTLDNDKVNIKDILNKH